MNRALAEVDAGLPAGPFRGVPFLIKDLYADSAGDPAHQGNRALRDVGWTADEDSWLVARLRTAGFAFLGRTNTPEFGLVPVTEPRAYGPCRNPWDRFPLPRRVEWRQRGGGGGGHGRGCARQRRRGFDPVYPPACVAWSGSNRREEGPRSGRPETKPGCPSSTWWPAPCGTPPRCSMSCGARSGDMVVAPPPVRPYVSEVNVRPAPLRIGFLDASPAGPIDPECQAAVQTAARLLEQLGHAVVDDHPHIGPAASQHFGSRWVVNARLRLNWLAGLLGRQVSRRRRRAPDLGHGVGRRGRVRCRLRDSGRRRQRLARHFGEWWDHHDLLLTPTLGQLPPLIGELEPPADDPFATQQLTARLVPFTTHFNVTGQPAISLPLHVSAAGLPVGTDRGRLRVGEDLLVQVAAQAGGGGPVGRPEAVPLT